MVQQEPLAEKATQAWTQQMDRWMESTNLCQRQMETFLGIWVDQIAEAQKEGQKFLKEWTSSVTRTQAELWKTWQTNLREGAKAFTPAPGPK